MSSCEQFVFSVSHTNHYAFDSIKQIFLTLMKKSTVPITIYYTPVNYAENSSLTGVMNQLRKTMRQNLIFAHSEIAELSSIQRGAEFTMSSDEEARLSTALHANDFNGIKRFIHNLFARAKAQKATQKALKNILLYVFSSAQKFFPLTTTQKPVITDIVDELLYNSLNYTELEENFLYYFSTIKNESTIASYEDLSQSLMHYIDIHFAEDLTNSQLSSIFGFSPAYLSKLFRMETGLSPSDYLSKVRMDYAKLLLEQRPDMLIKNIAAAVGYQDPLYFSRVFKKATGMTTTEYRSQLTKQEP